MFSSGVKTADSGDFTGARIAEFLRLATQRPKNPTRKGLALRRKVAMAAAAGKSNGEIAVEVGRKLRRIEQIVAEPESRAMIDHFRAAIERQRLEAESDGLELLVERAKATEGAACLPYIEQLWARLNALEARPGAGGSATNIQINNSPGVTLDDLIRATVQPHDE